MTGAPEDPGDLAARVQRAARAFGQQAEIVGVDAEVEIQRALRAEVAVDATAGVAGAQAHAVEGPVFAVLEHAAAAAGGIAAQLAGQIGEGDVEVVAAEGRAAGLAA